jgi:hypothetical protein
VQTYECAQCGAPAEAKLSDEGEIIGFERSCDHDTAGIAANMEATVYGEGHAK